MSRIFVVISGGLALLLLSACHGAAGPVVPSGQPALQDSGGTLTMLGGTAPWSGKIKHVVIIIQENRTVDNLFSGYPNADTQSWGLDHNGKRVPLVTVSMTAPYDVSHSHSSFETEYAGGKMNGFDQGNSKCSKPTACPPANRRAYAKVPKKEAKPYWDMAHQWVLADRMFQANQGPSFPAHQYAISGTSTIKTGSALRAAESPQKPANARGNAGGCDSPSGATVRLIDQSGNENRTAYPCFERPTLTDLLDAKSIVWHFYEYRYGPGYWYALDAIRHIYNRPDYRTIIEAPADRVLTDVLNGDLEPVVWITPEADDSDHAADNGRLADPRG